MSDAAEHITHAKNNLSSSHDLPTAKRRTSLPCAFLDVRDPGYLPSLAIASEREGVHIREASMEQFLVPSSMNECQASAK